jgi:hypothetical protein
VGGGVATRDERDLGTGIYERDRGGQSGEPGPDDDNVR